MGRAPGLILCLLLLCLPGRAQHIFHWRWQLTKEGLSISGGVDEQEMTTVRCSYPLVSNGFRFLYRTVDDINYKDANTYAKAMTALSKTTVLPFEKQLLQCDRISVEMDSGLLAFPIEFLQIKNTALALFRPMVFRVNGFARKNDSEKLHLNRGFILRDPTSDPEDACSTTFKQYPTSTFRSTNRLKPDDFNFKPGSDFALISAHGFVDSNTLRGCVFAKEKSIKPSLFKNPHFKLVYVDGCQQGINWSYIKTLAQRDNTTFYLGPIVSNDSGESSTKTINWFFKQLQQTSDPVHALWQTRKNLFAQYNRHINNLDVINKSFIFRIYKL